MGAVLSFTMTAQRAMPQAMQKLLNAEYAINSLYVDSVNEDKLIEDAIRGMLESLDPHSSYTDAKETKERRPRSSRNRSRVSSAASASSST